ncbi:GntR family transcriptional regulator [Clostridium perfringens]|uniref:GntR family transcriptional regulator n=1 Tax=Clostridium perfringens TaxID=1502 RepID=UPI0018E4C96E|nr:GntR family transcriptional regulator [Clostridium perfringens]EGT2191064.1 GntR family transcriptional regulator [Clostridium perfringens]EJT6142716.1 GntR family transcriptional regulator [Clostridium perfringens]MBI6083171.1 GntR family transcriptional regulator [Clostridium perfringens]MBI6103076.1 GntR family transcriptional regulator [Clostridium perfringens]MDK0647950.1 GntR family transcriptional regulator [Clostridium perfringens]
MNIVVSNTSGVPIYEQIAKAIKNEILSGDLKENSALPSIRSLASELRVSVITTKRAYEELERDGFIYTLPGKGSYVEEQNKELLMEEKLREIEEKLGEAIDIANSIGLNFEELVGMLKTLKEL